LDRGPPKVAFNQHFYDTTVNKILVILGVSFIAVQGLACLLSFYSQHE